MSLSQFMLPGETVLYEAPAEVRYGRTPYRLYVTGERLLLYAVAGLLSPKERLVAEPLADVGLLEYSEGGVFSARGRLDIKLPGNTLSITGDAETIKEVLRALQERTLRHPEADGEVTLIVPPEPLFDDLPGPPRQVEPLPVATHGGANRNRLRSGVVAALCLVVLAAAVVTTLFLNRRQSTSPPRGEAGATAPPAPEPTPDTAPAVRIMDETFAIPEGSHRAVKFIIPGGGAGARVAGGFRVTGGSYVNFYVMSEAQYDRFAAGAPADVTSAVYRREQWNVRVGERLPPGAYYLVFDNRDAGAGQQAVAAEFYVVPDEVAAVALP